jgi:20S proteasome alpha/beta subunit
MKNQEIQMLGCPAEMLEKQFKSQYNINMYVAGLLSDAQELLTMGKTVEANQLMNQVKYYFFEFTDTRNEVTV